MIRRCAYDGDALYEIAWDLWTRFPELRLRSAETIRVLAATIEQLVKVGGLELRWSTWEPHTIGERWDGQDEMDPMTGSGWMRLKGEDEVVGLIKPHLGDRSTFKSGGAS